MWQEIYKKKEIARRSVYRHIQHQTIMGDTSKAVFGRDKLPEIAIIRAGAHFPDRARRTLEQFDRFEEINGTWVPYSYATKDNIEAIITFNVYGAATTLEVIRILQDGGVKNIGFIGSAFSKKGKIGEQLLITKVFDQAGVTRMDGVNIITRDEEHIKVQQDFLEERRVAYTKATIASVPCVMHNIDNVRDFVGSEQVDGVEMELSTFFHFTEKANMYPVANIYVSDNPAYPVLDDDKNQLRENGMILSSQLAIDLLYQISQGQ